MREACTNSDEVDIYLFTETWLNDSHFDGELGLKNYTVFRKDRSAESSIHRRGGGVMMAVKKNFSAVQLQCNHKGVEH